MRISKRILLQKGFGLLEVLITIVVLGVALIALARFQGTLLQGGSYAKARSVALNLAQEKLEDLRNFEQLATAGAGTSTYAEIGTNVGGAENNDGTLVIPSGDITASNVTYDRTWTVTPYFYCADNQPPSTSNCSSSKPYPDFKVVTVELDWTDQEGAQSVQLEGTINASDPAKGVRALTTPPPKEKPYVGYVPGQRPEVIELDLGDDEKKEVTKPEPDTTRHELTTITSFDEVYYSSSTLRTLRRDEFFTLNCTCEQVGVPGENQEKGLTPTFFDGTTYVVGAQIDGKRTGAKATGGQLSEQPALCNVCCRDHHDVTDYPQYDPFRDSNEYLNGGDHKHYYPDQEGVLQLANASGDLYLEACRFVRVNGFLRVAQDWRLESFQVLPGGYLSTDVGIQAYTDYAKQFIEEYIKAIGDDYPQITPDPANFSEEFQNLLAALPTSKTMASDEQKQLIARGIYLNYLDASLVKLLQCKINPSLRSDCPNTEAESFLNIAPFHEVNLTRLANWSITGESIWVTDEPIEDGNEETYSRGLATAMGIGTSNATATMERSNTGLTDSRAIRANEAPELSDSIEIIVSSESDADVGITVSGTISIANNVVDREPSHIQVTGGNGVTCTKPEDTKYSCTLDASGNGTIAFFNYTTEAQNNEVNPSGGTVFDDCSLSEYAEYSFTGLTTNTTMDITIKKDGSGSC